MTLSDDPRGGATLLWLLVLVVVAPVVVTEAFLLIRRAWSRDNPAGSEISPQRLNTLVGGVGAVVRNASIGTELCAPSPGKSPPQASDSEAATPEPCTFPADVASRPAMHILDFSDPNAPREIVIYDRDPTGYVELNLGAGEHPPIMFDSWETAASAAPPAGRDRLRPGETRAGDAQTGVWAAPEGATEWTLEAAATPAPRSRNRAMSAAAAVAAAEQRARVVAAATRAAAQAASSLAIRRGSRATGRSGGDAAESDRSN